MSVRHVERPAAGAPVGALVFFHGFRGIPEDWVGFLDKIDAERRFHWYLPEAPHLDAKGCRSWFRRGGPTRPETQARQAREVLERAGAAVLYGETAIGHGIDEAVIPDLRPFLAKLP